MNKKYDITSLGTAYLDIDFLKFPFDEGLFVHRETVGSNYTVQPGGSALNFARTNSRLGARVAFVGQIGTDKIGKLLIELLMKDQVEPFFIKTASAQTNLAVHYVKNDGASIMTSGGAANQTLSAALIKKKITKILPQTKYLYLGGVYKLKKLIGHYAEFIQMAKQSQAQVLLDHGRVTNLVTQNEINIVRSLLPEIDVYLPSKDELLKTWESKSINQAIKKIRSVSNALVIIKDSNNGSYFCKPKTLDIQRCNSFKVKVIDSVGAGDTFNAGFISTYVKGHTLEESIKFATGAAAVKISNHSALSRKNVANFIENNTPLMISSLS